MKKPIRVLFVCHGNICRSPMAEYILKDMVAKAGIADAFEIGSAAVTEEELGNPVYPPARRILREKGVPCGDHRARLMTAADGARCDYILAMDTDNLRRMPVLLGPSPAASVARLLDYTDRPRDVEDPWYTGRFDRVFDDITEGCRAWLAYVTKRDG